MLNPMSYHTLLVREMEPGDADTVSALATRIWREHYPGIISEAQIEYMTQRMTSSEALLASLQEKEQRVWLLYDDGALVGYAALEQTGEKEWYIDKIYVDTARHRSGLGSYLLASLTRMLDPKALTLRVNRKNVKAVNFYFKHGFAIDRVLDTDIGGGFTMEDFVMRWAA